MATKSTEEPAGALPSAAPYQYEPLALSSSQFRVFTLLPSADRDAPLEGTLRIEMFQAEPRETCLYEALSYVWGTDMSSDTLRVNGAEMQITTNLAHALLYIRSACRPHDLWIDALCIDQQNLLEKNHQVGQMYRVFASASRVIVWLGLADEDSDYALSHLDHITTASRQSISRIERIFRRSWWARIWTFQEALAASTHSIVVCGNTTVPWHNVLQALKDILNHARHYSDPSIHRLLYFLEAHSLHRTSQRLTLDKLIMASSGRQAKDRRDYIYALLGLMNDGLPQDLEPDYAQSISVTFQRAIVRILMSHNRLDLIVYSLEHRELGTLRASWYGSETERKAFQDLGDYYLKGSFSVIHEGVANGTPSSEVTHDVPQGTIKLAGAIFGTISDLLCTYTTHLPLPERPPNVPKLYTVISELSCQVKEISKTVRELWVRLFPKQAYVQPAVRLVANGRRIEYMLNERPITDEFYREILIVENLVARYRSGICSELPHCHLGRASLLNNWEDLYLPKSADVPQGLAWNALFTIAVPFCNDITLFRTSDGHIGSSRGEIIIGDVLCILFGCQVPLVLRKKEKGYYKIIGTAYVDGIMDGDFFTNGREYELKGFELR